MKNKVVYINNLKKFLKEYGCIAAGSFILAFGINFFLVPMKISTGGVSGIATVIYYVFNIPLSVTTLFINIVLFFFGYKTLKKKAVLKTVLGIIFLSLFLEITEKFPFYSDDIMPASVFGGILVGLGVGITVLKDASTGGSDFAALMFHRMFPYISVGGYILLIDSAVIIISGLVFKDYTLMFYSVISLYISIKVTDWILIKGNHAKSVFIISAESREIARVIMEDMERGVTGIYSKGMYNNSDSIMLLCVVKSREIPQLINKVKNIDKGAFTVIADAREVHGQGFDMYN